jgi:DNA-binding transcriptional ArsR family regulator
MAELAGQGDVFSAIAAPARRGMLARLAQGDMPVLELAESFDMSVSAVSQHLSVLRSAGLVSTLKAGRQRIYKLNPEPLRAVADWAQSYEQFWNEKLVALGEFLEESK